MMIKRQALESFKTALENNKVVVLRGPRQSGKLTLCNAIFPSEHEAVCYVNCAVRNQKAHLETAEEFQKISTNKKILVLQNAQLLPNANSVLDWCFELESLENVVLVCSYEPELDSEFWEVFRTSGAEIMLSPLSYEECANQFGLAAEDQNIEDRLLYGYYPEVVASENKEETLLECLEKTLIRQLSSGERINKKEQLLKLLRKLAFQIGEVISYHELGQDCGLDNETVERYIVLFEKAGILFRLPSYFTDQKYELKKSFMVYFMDNGLRNALIRSFQPMEYRNDSEQLWKNWTLSERRKQLLATGKTSETYFWLTHTKQRIDYLEVTSGKGNAFQIVWQKTKKVKIPKSFTTYYPETKVGTITRSTLWGFLRS